MESQALLLAVSIPEEREPSGAGGGLADVLASLTSTHGLKASQETRLQLLFLWHKLCHNDKGNFTMHT